MEIEAGFDAITRDRVGEVLAKILGDAALENDTLLLMCHGASAKWLIRLLTQVRPPSSFRLPGS